MGPLGKKKNLKTKAGDNALEIQKKNIFWSKI